MSQGARRLLLLAGRLTAAECEGLRRRSAGLEARGFSSAVVCLRGEPSHRDAHAGRSGPVAPPEEGGRLDECPGLAVRWRRGWAVRDLMAGSPRPDLIHAFGIEVAEPVLALAERWRVPYLLTIDEFLPPGGRLRLSRSRCRGLIATAPELAADLSATVGVPRRAVEVIRPGIVPCDDASPVPGSDGAPSAWVPVIGTASPLTSGSGLATFLHAARRVLDADRDAEFLIAGRGPAEEPLRRLAEALRVGDRVTFADAAAEDLPFWRVLDVFCLPALVPTTGPSLARALAHGVPSIASDVAGLDGLVIEGSTGLRFPCGDSTALSRAIVDLLSDPARRHELGRRGRAHIARHFDPDREADDLARAYVRALASGEPVVGRPRAFRADPRPPRVG